MATASQPYATLTEVASQLVAAVNAANAGGDYTASNSTNNLFISSDKADIPFSFVVTEETTGTPAQREQLLSTGTYHQKLRLPAFSDQAIQPTGCESVVPGIANDPGITLSANNRVTLPAGSTWPHGLSGAMLQFTTADGIEHLKPVKRRLDDQVVTIKNTNGIDFTEDSVGEPMDITIAWGGWSLEVKTQSARLF